MQQRKYRNKEERNLIRTDVIKSLDNIQLSDVVVQTLTNVLDKFVEKSDQPGELRGNIPIPEIPGRCIEYYLPSRRILKSEVKIAVINQDEA
jgi:hypothetical protein